MLLILYGTTGFARSDFENLTSNIRACELGNKGAIQAYFCVGNIKLKRKYIVEGEIISFDKRGSKFEIKLLKGHYATVFLPTYYTRRYSRDFAEPFSKEDLKLIKILQKKTKVSFLGKLLLLGSGSVTKHEINFLEFIK